MNVISASRRTDIPAWYGSWFMKRVEAGKAFYRNPFGGGIHEVSLKPGEVIAIVFWTKRAGPFLEDLARLLAMDYKAYFQFTLTGYGPLLEKGVPPWPKVLKDFKALSDMLGPRYVRWRYDPIVMGGSFDRDFHLKNFSALSARLEGYTDACHVSFVQFYKKTRRNLDLLARNSGTSILDLEAERKTALAGELQSIAASRDIRLLSCCCPLLGEAGVPEGGCVDPELIRSLRPDLEGLSMKLRPTRKGCRCAESRDIGAYDTCPGGCVYCYATQNPDAARRRFDVHDSGSELL